MKHFKTHKQTGSSFIVLLVAMVFVYFLLFSISARGWGYIGYNGYRAGPSFWYWGGPRIYNMPSTRDGSLGGPGTRGGGYSGGK